VSRLHVVPAMWAARDMSGAYEEREHAADLWLMVYGNGLPVLFEHALYALYSHLVDIAEVLPLRSWQLNTSGADAAEAVRAMLAEALYRFDAESLIGATARVEVRAETGSGLEVKATAWGETFDPERHSALCEIKAVTYHQLAVEQDMEHGWRASILLDV
jgi:SHS2 domain-containing protein